MKFADTSALHRFHVHIHVADLDQNIRFYSQLFGHAPTVTKPDYAKWMLDDPRINFAISTGKSDTTGIAHLGLQADTPEALQDIGARLQAADAVTLAEAATTCCYARSDKFWARDPQGIHWETFHTFGDATSYFAPRQEASEAATGACCEPVMSTNETRKSPEAARACSPASGCC